MDQVLMGSPEDAAVLSILHYRQEKGTYPVEAET